MANLSLPATLKAIHEAIRLISSLKFYKFLGEKLGPFKFIELFNLEEKLSRKASVQSSLEHRLEILKEALGGLDERHKKQTIFLYRVKFSTRSVPDIAFTKPTREAFKMLHSSFQKANCRPCLKTRCTISQGISAFQVLRQCMWSTSFEKYELQVICLQTCMPIMPAIDQAVTVDV